MALAYIYNNHHTKYLQWREYLSKYLEGPITWGLVCCRRGCCCIRGPITPYLATSNHDKYLEVNYDMIFLPNNYTMCRIDKTKLRMTLLNLRSWWHIPMVIVKIFTPLILFFELNWYNVRIFYWGNMEYTPRNYRFYR